MYYSKSYTPDELYHFGIKGMKWGVRRYENPDGTLTEAGKKRYRDDVGSDTKKALKNAIYGHRKYEEASYKKYLKREQQLRKKYGHPGEDSVQALEDFYRTDRSKKYDKERSKAFNKYENEEAWRKDLQNENKNWQTVKNDKALRSLMSDAKKTINKISDLEEQYVGKNSKAYKDALKKYKEKHNSSKDAELDFDQKVWYASRDYEKEYAKFKKASEKLNEKRSGQVREILRKGLGKKTYNSLNDGQLERGEDYVSYRIQKYF